ncbi:hypothetical protein AB0E77_28825 [Streptomyces sp. NPDC032940]|uniref:hypothetical protein n=1 Tax=Streptomyces sp. NPDC032940 TaxID=3155366 RepID=UPI0034062157
MSQHAAQATTQRPDGRGAVRKLTAVLVGLTALVTLMLGAFALPSIHSGPRDMPVGVTGARDATRALQQKLDTDMWDVTVYDDAGALTSAVKDRDVVGGLGVSASGVDVYTATAASPMGGTLLTSLGNTLAAQQRTRATVHDLLPYPGDDPRGAGLSAAALPLIFGGMFPAVVLTRIFPGHRGLRTRLAGAVLFSLLAGAAVTAFLQYGTGSLTGNYAVTALGVSLGMAALSMTFIGLEALFGFAGLGIGAAVMMFLGNPLSGLATGPHWLPEGWSTLGQLLPPGASGSLLRANAYFDGTGAATPALTLAVWVVLGLLLILAADRRGVKAGGGEPAAGAAAPASVAGG